MKIYVTRLILAAAVMATALSSCGEKKKTNEIITHKPAVKKPSAPTAMQEYKHRDKTEWLGKTYIINVYRRTDKGRGIITDDSGNKYYDNSISLRILRADGTTFFDKTFSKTDFSTFVDNEFMKENALLGIVFDKVEGDKLKFVASIGAPDVLSDEYVPLSLTISRTGNISITKDTSIETQESADDENEEGV